MNLTFMTTITDNSCSLGGCSYELIINGTQESQNGTLNSGDNFSTFVDI